MVLDISIAMGSDRFCYCCVLKRWLIARAYRTRRAEVNEIASIYLMTFQCAGWQENL